MKGIFITFEGTEGCGKSTQVKLLADNLRAEGRDVITLREPGGTPLGEELRHLLKHSDAGKGMDPVAELLLMNASRAQLVRDVIRPALASGKVVICDRFYDSTVAYQGYGRGLPLETICQVVNSAVLDQHGFTTPNRTYLITVPIEVSEERRKQRGGVSDRFEEAERGFFERVLSGYQEILRNNPQRIMELDGTRGIIHLQREIFLAFSNQFPC